MKDLLTPEQILNAQLNAIFHASSDGILVCDSKGNILKMNEASEKLNGMKARDVIGKNVAHFVETGVFDRSVTMEVLETKRQVSIMQYIKKTNKHLLVTGTPSFDDKGNIVLVVVNERDMTQLNAMKERLEESQMVAEKFRDELVQLSMREVERQEIVAESGAMRRLLNMALRLARFDASNILILGESGTGKGVVAKFIHKNGRRSKKPFVQINCAAVPETLLEAELFGYEKGAFTGARQEGKLGLFELAHEGTLFLDEIGDLPFSVQAKLLKCLDDDEVMRLGSVKPRKVDCCIIAATNKELETVTKEGRFRKDLFYRLNTFTLHIPPLRERREDILPLINFFLARHNKQYGQKKRISSRGFDALQSWLYPGNVRELDSILKKAVLISDKNLLDDFVFSALETSMKKGSPRDQLGEEEQGQRWENEILLLEEELLRRALNRCNSTREIARYLGVSQPTVVRKMKKHGLPENLIHNRIKFRNNLSESK
jgi:PAS domain S-box-containing protein